MIPPARFALLGKSGSGKSSAGLVLSRHLGIRHIKTGAICREISRLLFGNEDKRSTQMLDDALTPIDASIFLRAAVRSLDERESYVIDALRFGQDAELARALGCTLIRVVAPPELRHSRLDKRGQAFDPEVDGAHRSEIELDDIEVDHQVLNDTDVASFEATLLAVATKA